MANPNIIGNEFWKFRKRHGRKTIYTPEEFLDKAFEYFQWNNDNPLMEAKIIPRGVVKNKGKEDEEIVFTIDIPKMRAMSISGLCNFADINTDTFYEYAKRHEFADVIRTIKDVMYQQKFEAASAELLNANIISRDLGLVDKQQIDQTVKDDDYIRSLKKATKLSNRKKKK